jgi:hypothetical protein
MNRPKNWPDEIVYLYAPNYSPRLTNSQKLSLKKRSLDLIQITTAYSSNGPSSSVKIHGIDDASHPAKGQFGLFAAKNLKPGSFIIHYLGLVHPDSAANLLSDYDLWLDREAEVAVDAEKCGNEARFINDYRGVRDKPNVEFKEVWSERFGQKCMAVFVLPQREKGSGKQGIAKGEEILVSYGKGFWNHRNGVDEGPGETTEQMTS